MNNTQLLILATIGIVILLNLIGLEFSSAFVPFIVLLLFIIYEGAKFLFGIKIDQEKDNAVGLIFKIFFILSSVMLLLFLAGFLFICVNYDIDITVILLLSFIPSAMLFLCIVCIFEKPKKNLELRRTENKKINSKTVLIILIVLFSITIIGKIIYKFPRLYVSPPIDITKEQEDIFYACYNYSGSKRDDCITKLAIELLDEKICQKISGQKSPCYEEVAVAKKDAKLCEELSDYAKKRCYSKIAVLTNDLVLCEKSEGYLECFEKLGTTREEAQKEINKILYEEEQSAETSFIKEINKQIILDNEELIAIGSKIISCWPRNIETAYINEDTKIIVDARDIYNKYLYVEKNGKKRILLRDDSDVLNSAYYVYKTNNPNYIAYSSLGGAGSFGSGGFHYINIETEKTDFKVNDSFSSGIEDISFQKGNGEIFLIKPLLENKDGEDFNRKEDEEGALRRLSINDDFIDLPEPIIFHGVEDIISFDILVEINLIGFKKDLSGAYFNFSVNNFDAKENKNILKKGLEFSFEDNTLNWVDFVQN